MSCLLSKQSLNNKNITTSIDIFIIIIIVIDIFIIIVTRLLLLLIKQQKICKYIIAKTQKLFNI